MRILHSHARWTTTLAIALVLFAVPLAFLRAAGSSWSPTVLVNTEAFFIVDDVDTSSNIVVKFGQTLAKTITYNRTLTKFEFNDDLDVTGTITGSALSVGGVTYIDGTNAGRIEGVANGMVLLRKGVTNKGFAQDFAGSNFGQHFWGVGVRIGAETTDPRSNDWDIPAGNLIVTGTASGKNLTFMGASNSYILGSLAIGKSGTPNTKLEVVGTISGSAVTSVNLVNSTSATSGSILVSRTSRSPEWKTPSGAMVWFLDGVAAVATPQGAQVTLPFGFAATSVNLRAANKPTGSNLTVDIKKDNQTIFTTKPWIYPNYLYGGTGAVFSISSFTGGTVLTVGITQVGSTVAGSGITIQLNGTRRY